MPVLLALSLAGAVVAAASSLAVTPSTLGASTVTVPRCGTTPLSVVPVLTTSTVTGVAIGGLSAACGGATLKVTARVGATAGSGSSVVPPGGGSVTVPIVAGPTLSTALQTDVVVEGP